MAENSEQSGIQKERELLLSAQKKGGMATLGAYFKLSGPGWLQSAITLGGGSLAGSLYLGVLGGTALLWLQPLAMIMGVIMLSAISYVALSTGERPFQAVNKHVNPVLGWGWALATLMANLVWALPQFSLGTAAATQNLFPALGTGTGGKLVVCISLLVVCSFVVLLYDQGGRGLKIFEGLLKVLVGVIVICFAGVVVKLFSAGELAFGQILSGFIPNLSLLSAPPPTMQALIDAVDPEHQSYWRDIVVGQQRSVMITAAATAVGINMTFLLPYSLLKRGWDKNFRGLAIFDLSTGLFIPFVLATACVVIASASQFHTKPAPGFFGETDDSGQVIQASGPMISGAHGRIIVELGAEAFDALSDEEKAQRVTDLPDADRMMAAVLIKRDAWSLADSLEPFTGPVVAQYTFGIGVLAMAFSTIIILMLINGFVVCEMLGLPNTGWPYRLACLAPGVVGALGPFFWSKAAFWLAVPTSMFGMVLLPVAYFTFYLLMNQKSLLGDNMPRGAKRFVWNTLMALAAGLATFGSVYSICAKLGKPLGLSIIVAFTLLAVIVHFVRKAKPGVPA